jgi:GNAT superfamily N-acetyltransferase
VPEVEAVTIDPRDGVIAVLRRMLDSPTAFCLVGGDGGPGLEGFVTGAVISSGADDASIGIIGELYVRPRARRQGLGTELVDIAVDELSRRGAMLYKAEVPPDWTDGVAFWRHRKRWEQDALIFSRYD